MPNYCNGIMTFSGLSLKDCNKLRSIIKKNVFCETVYPQSEEVKADSKTEMAYRKAEKKYVEKNKVRPPKEWYDKMRQKYPYKQLWYDWNCLHWGTKWGMCDAEMTDKESIFHDGMYKFTVNFWTARSPLSDAVLEKCSEMFDCDIYYEYDEPGMGFSGKEKWSSGMCIYSHHYDDAYFGEGTYCAHCNGVYSQDEFFNYELRICDTCGEDIMHQFRQEEKQNKMEEIVNSVNSRLPEDEFKKKLIARVKKEFSLTDLEAEFVCGQYQTGRFERHKPNNNEIYLPF